MSAKHIRITNHKDDAEGPDNWRWVLRSENGSDDLSSSTQGYSRRIDALNCLAQSTGFDVALGDQEAVRYIADSLNGEVVKEMATVSVEVSKPVDRDSAG